MSEEKDPDEKGGASEVSRAILSPRRRRSSPAHRRVPGGRGVVDHNDANAVGMASELVLGGRAVSGAVDAGGRLTAAGGWGLPGALSWALAYEPDSGGEDSGWEGFS